MGRGNVFFYQKIQVELFKIIKNQRYMRGFWIFAENFELFGYS